MIDHTILESDDGIRLDRWFKRHYAGLPHALLEKYLRKGDIRIDGKKAKSSDRIVTGQVLRCPQIKLDEIQKRQPVKIDQREAEEIRKWVLYKDDNILVINKPAGLAVQGGTKVHKSVDGLLGALMMDRAERPRLVHRLDRDTSGCLVLARTRKAATVLSAGFAGKDIEKTYWALVNGAPIHMKDVIDVPLAKMTEDETAYEAVTVDENEGKYAITEYSVLDTLARKFTLMELKPLTGRTHQLRVHMAHIGCPIVGDHKYGGSMDSAESIGVENRLHLHARRIVIPPMLGGKRIDVTAPLPKHMKKSFEALGLDGD